MNNILMMTDGYKPTQYKQYPPETTEIYSYIESRGGEYNKLVFFGLQIFLKKYLSKPITMADIDEADKFYRAYFSDPKIFNRAGWEYILDKYDGYLPVKIKALPEGTVVNSKEVMVTVVNTDRECFWLTSYLETALLRAVWYPTTVASRSKSIKNVIEEYLIKTSSVPVQDMIDFKLHDFGARGVSSGESAAIGGAAHLVNFKGSDTIEGVMYANKYYGVYGLDGMAAFSIPASEHSTITSWGNGSEFEAFENMIEQYGSGLYACVSDSYNIWEALELWKELEAKILEKGGTLVVRPDSGDPVYTPCMVIKNLLDLFGYTINEKGYKVLPDHIRVIQGDGINEDSISRILETLKVAGISAENIAFGMGGELLQTPNRDTNKFAMKCSNAIVSGKSRYVFKDPVTDQGKKSKMGKFVVVRMNGSLKTLETANMNAIDAMETVFENGKVVKTYTLDQVRENANKG